MNCALALDDQVKNDPDLRLHVGIHLGDLVVQGGEVSGDGVNIASRICALSEGGGLRVSGEVYRSIRNQPGIEATALGEQELKNVPEPVTVYAIRGRAAPPRAISGAVPKARPRALLVAGVVVFLLVAGLLVWRLPTTPSIAPGDEQFTVPGFGDVPAIAVLPFDNLSGDLEQEYFADGISEELITRLSSLRRLPVIARNSTFTYKGQAIDVQQVGRELGARYVVEGSVRKAGDRVRISAQLIDAANGHHVWAEAYDRELREVFAVQDEITEAIVGAIGPQIGRSERERAARLGPRDLTAYDLMQRGWWHLFRLTREDGAKALSLFKRAAEADPRLAAAFLGIVNIGWGGIYQGWTDPTVELITEIRQAAEQCCAVESDSWTCHSAMGLFYSLSGQPTQMISAFERAVELEPSNAGAYWQLGLYLALAGRADEAIQNLEMAIRLSPKDPLQWVTFFAVGMAHFSEGRYDAAADWARRSLQWKRTNNTLAYPLLAASYAHLGRIEEARAMLEEQLRIQPQFSDSMLRAFYSTADPDVLGRYIDGLRMAGLPEE
jgi:TolB-like protein